MQKKVDDLRKVPVFVYIERIDAGSFANCTVISNPLS